MVARCFSLLLIILVLPITAQVQRVDEQLQKLLMAESAITTLYVEAVDDEKIVEAAIQGMLKELDPHSTYLNSDEVKKSNESLQGNFDGIGIQFNMIEDTLFIVQPISDGPSERVGILPGDRIVSVNDTVIAGVGMSDQKIMNRLRGPKGTEVKLGVMRKGISNTLFFYVIRDKIPVKTIDASYIVSEDIGYIKISTFGLTTVEEFIQAILDLKSQGASNLILDLQGNGGGYLMSAVGIANEFLLEDQLIVYTEGRRSPKIGYSAKGSGNFLEGKLIVLIDEYSASAAEIVAGAVQDWDRAIIVGRRSFGKGLVQRPVEFNDGSMIRLTIANYYTPSGRSIQKPYNDGSQYGLELNERFNNGELMSADSVHFPDSLKYKTLTLDRTVYGGGGIMPDYFIPLDTMRYTKLHRELSAKGVILRANLAYVEKNRRALQVKYRDFEIFDKEFNVEQDFLNLLIQKAKELGVELDQNQYNSSLPMLSIQLKALVARDLWTLSDYFKIINRLDDSVEKAIELLGKKSS